MQDINTVVRFIITAICQCPVRLTVPDTDLEKQSPSSEVCTKIYQLINKFPSFHENQRLSTSQDYDSGLQSEPNEASQHRDTPFHWNPS
jgi:hypothetical protein